MSSKMSFGDERIDWVNSLFLVITPVVAVGGTICYGAAYGITWVEIANFLFMFLATGLGITAGYHRYYTHRSYDCNKPLQIFYLIFGAAAVQNSVLNWCSDHRYHHRFVDTEEDPYNILRGGLYAHMGWIFRRDTRQLHEKYKNIPDLLKDPLVVWQDKWYLPIVLIFTFALPTYIGLLAGRPLGGLIFGGFVRVVVVHHMTFFINSLAHLYGTRKYTNANTARDSWWLGLFTFGEGYHNFHHAFQSDYRNGLRWWQFDMTKWWIISFNIVGCVWRLKRTSESAILKARLQVEMEIVDRRLAGAHAPQNLWDKVHGRLESGRRRLEEAMARYQGAKIEYTRQKKLWSDEARRQFAAKKELYYLELRVANLRWREMIRALNRIPQPSAPGILTLTAIVNFLKTPL